MKSGRPFSEKGFRRKRSAIARPNGRARMGMLAALAELYSDKPGLVGEDALGERERIRVEDEARRAKQGVLPLRGAN